MTKERLHSLWSLGLVLLIGSLMFTTPAGAIPTAGNYQFTSGLTGTFTSTGFSLSEWSFTDVTGLHWANHMGSAPVLSNDKFLFRQHQFEFPPGADQTLNPFNRILTIDWATPILYNMRAIREGFIPNLGPPLTLTWAIQPTATVPEPSSASMAGLGLLLLLGYGWWQRRQAGLQVG